MPLRESLFDAPQPSQDSDAPSTIPVRRPRRVHHAARRRARPVVQRPTAAVPNSFSLAILPISHG